MILHAACLITNTAFMGFSSAHIKAKSATTSDMLKGVERCLGVPLDQSRHVSLGHLVPYNIVSSQEVSAPWHTDEKKSTHKNRKPPHNVASQSGDASNLQWNQEVVKIKGWSIPLVTG